MPAFSNDPETEFPTRYWVSVKLSKTDGRFGAVSQGLRPFLNYEFQIAPVLWSEADVAGRVVNTITYLFLNGDVLNDGDTFGGSEQEKFELKYDKRKKIIRAQVAWQ